MASALVIRASAGTTTNPDQRQRLIEYQAASKQSLAVPSTTAAPLSAAQRQAILPSPLSGLPRVGGEVGFTTSLIVQRLTGERRKYAPVSRQKLYTPPQSRLRDFLV